jgi:hypothetical protein
MTTAHAHDRVFEPHARRKWGLRKVLQVRSFLMMERTGIEPVTSGLQSRESR